MGTFTFVQYRKELRKMHSRRTLLTLLALATVLGSVEARSRCVVRNTDDSGEGSLRRCLEKANESGPQEQYTIAVSREITGERVINNPSGADYPQVTEPSFLKFVGRGITIEALVPTPEGRLPTIFWTGANVSLEVDDCTVIGGFECIRMSETIGGNDPGDTIDVNLTVEGVQCSRSSGSGLFVNENIGAIHIRRSSFDNNGQSGIQINPAAPGDVEEDEYEISLTRVECSNNSNGWGTFIDILSAPVGGTLTVSKYIGNNNGEYGLEAFDNGEGRLFVPSVKLSTFNNNNEGIEFVNADVELIAGCEINGNTEYGLGLEQSSLVAIKRSIIENNGEFGIDLAVTATVESIDNTKISGNGFGIIKCGPDESGRSTRSAP